MGSDESGISGHLGHDIASLLIVSCLWIEVCLFGWLDVTTCFGTQGIQICGCRSRGFV